MIKKINRKKKLKEKNNHINNSEKNNNKKCEYKKILINKISPNELRRSESTEENINMNKRFINKSWDFNNIKKENNTNLKINYKKKYIVKDIQEDCKKDTRKSLERSHTKINEIKLFNSNSSQILFNKGNYNNNLNYNNNIITILNNKSKNSDETMSKFSIKIDFINKNIKTVNHKITNLEDKYQTIVNQLNNIYKIVSSYFHHRKKSVVKRKEHAKKKEKEMISDTQFMNKISELYNDNNEFNLKIPNDEYNKALKRIEPFLIKKFKKSP